MTIGHDTMLSRNGDILHAPVGTEEAVMMSVTAGAYYGVNAVGARLWELLETPATAGELCARIHDEFDVDEATCNAAVLKFLDDLVANGVVHAAAP
jgi:hypothetical protein